MKSFFTPQRYTFILNHQIVLLSFFLFLVRCVILLLLYFYLINNFIFTVVNFPVSNNHFSIVFVNKSTKRLYGLKSFFFHCFFCLNPTTEVVRCELLVRKEHSNGCQKLHLLHSVALLPPQLLFQHFRT